MRRRHIVLLSGGLDSTVLLAHTLLARLVPQEHEDVVTLSFRYGQKHSRELDAAFAISEHFGILKHEVLDVASALQFKSNPLTNPSEKMPMGLTYDELKSLTGVAKTYVPNRNAILLSIAAGLCYDLGGGTVAYAAHRTDARGGAYPDCTHEFVSSISMTTRIATAGKVQIVAPFILRTKSEVVRLGTQLDVPFEMTWSCYEGGDVHCGECPTCLERKQAFIDAEVGDPTEYLK